MSAATNVLIIGGGMAGLAAAERLARCGVDVTIVEARKRLGGRVWTIWPEEGAAPAELGAEFVHGKKVLTWDYIRKYNLKTVEVPDRHWQSVNRVLIEDCQFWKQLSEILERINPRSADMSFAAFLEQQTELPKKRRGLGLDFVEGFHAAPAAEISVHAIAEAEAASEKEEGTRAYWVREGYSALVERLAEAVQAEGGKVVLGTQVSRVLWGEKPVRVMARAGKHEELFAASKVLVTVPIGVLRAGGLNFEPPLLQKERAFANIGCGTVVKVILHFRARIWPVKHFGFLHSEEPPFQTWWADERGPSLVAWSGGPGAARIAAKGEAAVTVEAVEAVARVLNLEPGRVKEQSIGTYLHDWGADPCSRCAYSYSRAGEMGLVKELAAPVNDQVFFAGEATNAEGDQGTVHGALATGLRAAEEILAALGRPEENSGEHVLPHASGG